MVSALNFIEKFKFALQILLRRFLLIKKPLKGRQQLAEQI